MEQIATADAYMLVDSYRWSDATMHDVVNWLRDGTKAQSTDRYIYEAAIKLICDIDDYGDGDWRQRGCVYDALRTIIGCANAKFKDASLTEFRARLLHELDRRVA